MTHWPSIAHDLAQALRSTPDRCARDYDMKAVKVCGRCRALEAYDRAVAEMQIVQSPARPNHGRWHVLCPHCVCKFPE